MLELASVGAKVLQTRSVGLAMRYNLPLQVLSSFEDRPGTMIVGDDAIEDYGMERQLITGIAYDKNEARVTLTGLPDRPGAVAAIFAPLAEADINVDMIVQSVPRDGQTTDLTFTVPARLARPRRRRARASARTRSASTRSLTDTDVVKVSVVGVGMRSNPGVAAKMFETLAERRINILAITTSRDQGLGADPGGLYRARGAGAAHRLSGSMRRRNEQSHGRQPRGVTGNDERRHLDHRPRPPRRLMKRGTDFLGCEVAILGGAMSWISERNLVSRSVQCRRVRGDRLRGDDARPARHRDRRDEEAHATGRSASTSSPCTRCSPS